MKIATWNLNSINARKLHLLNWLKANKPNVVLLQELKCEEIKFPKEEIEDLGYNICVHSQKALNGVAILSLHPIEEVIIDFPGNPIPEQARYIEAVISCNGSVVRVASVYVPNGESPDSDKYPIKVKFLDAFTNYCASLIKLDEKIIIGGDYNIAPENIDVFSPDETEHAVLFNLEMRKKFRSILNLGYYNAFRLVHPNTQEYSWWDYRAGAWQRNQGMLIDHLLLSPEAADVIKTSQIDKSVRGLERASDHVPVICELAI